MTYFWAVDSFQRFLTDWLFRQGWSINRLAEATGVSQSLISRWLHPDPQRRIRPTDTSLSKLAPIVGVSQTDLMRLVGRINTDEDEPTQPDPIESDIRSRTAELLTLVRGAPQAFWPVIIRTTFDRAIDGARDMVNLIQSAGDEPPPEDRAADRPEHRVIEPSSIASSRRRQREIKPRHPVVALAA